MKLLVQYKYMNCILNKTKSTGLTLVASINYLTYYVTNILLIIFWYYLLAPVEDLWKQINLERYAPVLLEQSFFNKYTPS